MPVLKDRRVPGAERRSRSRRSRRTPTSRSATAPIPTKTRLALGQIQRLYQEKGYELAEVRLVEGGNIGDTKVVFQIFEGPKFKIASIDFKGNVFASDAQLWTKITSRKPILGLVGGKYHRDMLEEDERKLRSTTRRRASSRSRSRR